uniref:TRAF-interacting protein with FHA domain-containing protein A n=1 Tax=Strongyloides venezuelensis TaxID=75913 RepID=A0A0K0FSM1_STRVS
MADVNLNQFDVQCPISNNVFALRSKVLMMAKIEIYKTFKLDCEMEKIAPERKFDCEAEVLTQEDEEFGNVLRLCAFYPKRLHFSGYTPSVSLELHALCNS